MEAARPVVLEPTEQQWQMRVIGFAQYHDWRVAHFRPALNRQGKWRTAVAGDGKGFPDLVLVRSPRLIFAELKSKTGRLGPSQKLWLERLNGVAMATPYVETYIWRPADWDAVQGILERR